MRILIGIVGLAVVALAVWRLSPNDVMPPASLFEAQHEVDHKADNQASMPVARPKQLVAERHTAVATGSLAVTRFGDGSCELRVEVTDALGKPAEHAQVTWHTGPHEAPVATMATDERGRCSLRVSPGRLYVRARHREIGTSILLQLATDDQRVAVPRLALMRPVEVVGVVQDAQRRPVAGAQLIVQALLGIPAGHAAECVSSELVQCDDFGVFSFEASYGTRGTLLLAGDGEAAKSQCSFAAGFDDYLIVGPSGVAKIVRGNVGRDPAASSTDPAQAEVASSSVEQAGGYRAAAVNPSTQVDDPVVALAAQWQALALGASPFEVNVRYPDGRLPSRLQACERQSGPRVSTLKWQREVLGPRILAKCEHATSWWFVVDRDTGDSAYFSPLVAAAVELHLMPPGELRVMVNNVSGASRGLHVTIEPRGNTQRSQVRSNGSAQFRLPVGPVRIRVLRGLEVLAAKIVQVRSGELLETTLPVDLSR